MSGVPLGEALPQAPPRRPARPTRDGALARLRGRRRGRRDRAPARACCFDTGGTGKGLAADLVAAEPARLLALHRRLRRRHPHRRRRRPGPPLRGLRRTPAHAASAPTCCGSAPAASPPPGSTSASGAAPTAASPTTCSTRRRGEPAWTGLVGATALGDTAVEAETLSKAALLSGPEGGRAGPRRARRPAGPRQRPRRAGRSARGGAADPDPRSLGGDGGGTR